MVKSSSLSKTGDFSTSVSSNAALKVTKKPNGLRLDPKMAYQRYTNRNSADTLRASAKLQRARNILHRDFFLNPISKVNCKYDIENSMFEMHAKYANNLHLIKTIHKMIDVVVTKYGLCRWTIALIRVFRNVWLHATPVPPELQTYPDIDGLENFLDTLTIAGCGSGRVPLAIVSPSLTSVKRVLCKKCKSYTEVNATDTHQTLCKWCVRTLDDRDTMTEQQRLDCSNKTVQDRNKERDRQMNSGCELAHQVAQQCHLFCKRYAIASQVAKSIEAVDFLNTYLQYWSQFKHMESMIREYGEIVDTFAISLTRPKDDIGKDMLADVLMMQCFTNAITTEFEPANVKNSLIAQLNDNKRIAQSILQPIIKQYLCSDNATLQTFEDIVTAAPIPVLRPVFYMDNGRIATAEEIDTVMTADILSATSPVNFNGVYQNFMNSPHPEACDTCASAILLASESTDLDEDEEDVNDFLDVDY